VPVRELDDASLRSLTVTSAEGAFVREAGGTQVFLLTERGRKAVVDPAMVPASVPEMPAAALALFADAGPLAAGTFVKGSTSGTVSALHAGQLRGISSWSDLIALNGGNPVPQILTLDQRIADLLPWGATQRGPGTLVVAPRNATVYFVDGYDQLIPVGSFTVTAELGATRLLAVTNADVDAYTVRPGVITTVVECGGVRYWGIGGKLYRVGADAATAYPALPVTTTDPVTCGVLPKADGELSRFLRAANGTIFYVDAGTKRPISSYAAYLALGGTSANTIAASAVALAHIPTGALLSSPAQLSGAGMSGTSMSGTSMSVPLDQPAVEDDPAAVEETDPTTDAATEPDSDTDGAGQ
jgi:hypothetical protein